MGRRQLSNLEDFVRKRNEIAKQYERLLADIKEIVPFKTPANIRHSYYKYPLRVKESIGVEELASTLKNEYGIETGNIYYPPCHLHPFYRENFGTKEGDLPTSENVLKRVICLPVHAGLGKEDAEYVSNALHRSL